MNWKPIEQLVVENPIWVIKYDMYEDPITRTACASSVPGAIKFTDCHGYYTSEQDALAVMFHFPKPNSYRVEKVYQRKLINAE
jgi:hypothetical protein